jgi:hypothetical protein
VYSRDNYLNFNDHFAGVGAREKSSEGCGRILETLHNRFLCLNLSLLFKAINMIFHADI